MAKSIFFRAFVEGSTISDGRTITADMIDQVVETFNTETYTPRINIEHIAGFSPEPPFNGYGDVVAVKAQDDDFTIAGKVEKRRALYAQVDGNAQLTALAKKGQKPFPSVELTPNYAGTDKIGLVGMAFTDTPASIGTQKLAFSRSAPGTVFAAAADAVDFQFEAEPADATSIADAIKMGFAGVAAMFSREPAKPKEPEAKPANDNFDVAAFTTAMGETTAKVLGDALAPVLTTVNQLQSDFTKLKGDLEQEEAPKYSRQLATGGGGNAANLTDC